MAGVEVMKMRQWTVDELVTAWVLRAVRRAPSLSEAARRIGWHRRSLQRWLDKRGVRPRLAPGGRRKAMRR
jgi:ActR/RegA family two-component response regulator